MLKFMTTLALGVLLATAARADDTPLPMSGVWTGTVGTFPVNVCLQVQSGDSFNFGGYYYLSHLKLISLQAGDKANAGKWTEGDDPDKPDAIWSIAMKGDDISGSWAGNGKTLDVNLHRLAKLTGDDVDSPCGSGVFFNPRVSDPKIKETPSTLDGQAYTKIEVDAGKQFDVSYETFQLKGSGEGVAKINKLLMPGGGKDYVECLQQAATMGRDGDYEVTNTPKILTPHWLVVEESDGSSCGGAHPVNSSDETVYNPATGETLDLTKWLAPGAIKDGMLQGKLNKLVQAKYAKGRSGDDDKECVDAVKSPDGWSISLSKQGVVFLPALPYVAVACADPVEVGFNDVAPFLNAEGKKQLADFRSEVK